MGQSFGFKVQGSGFRVEDSGFRVQGEEVMGELWVHGLGCKGVWVRINGSGVIG